MKLQNLKNIKVNKIKHLAFRPLSEITKKETTLVYTLIN